MNDLGANLLVIAIVLVSAGYCVWRLGPRRLREAIRGGLSKVFPRLAQKGESSSACGACSGCALNPTKKCSDADSAHQAP